MEKLDEGRTRYKWSNSATNLLISIWSHEQVQNQLQMSTRNQPIWESIARYMSRRGFSLSGLQCKTRIKNMLCTYHEAVRKKDPSVIEPYFNIFKKVTESKPEKRKELRNKWKQETESDNSDVNDSEMPEVSFDAENAHHDSEYVTEYLDLGTSELKRRPSGVDVGQLERILTNLIESQTKNITNVIRMQTEMIEKLLASERERLETIMASERESRRQLETRLDRLVTRLETNSVPQLKYMGGVIGRQSDDPTI